MNKIEITEGLGDNSLVCFNSEVPHFFNIESMTNIFLWLLCLVFIMGLDKEVIFQFQVVLPTISPLLHLAMILEPVPVKPKC